MLEGRAPSRPGSWRAGFVEGRALSRPYGFPQGIGLGGPRPSNLVPPLMGAGPRGISPALSRATAVCGARLGTASRRRSPPGRAERDCRARIATFRSKSLRTVAAGPSSFFAKVAARRVPAIESQPHAARNLSTDQAVGRGRWPERRKDEDDRAGSRNGQHARIRRLPRQRR